MSERSIFATDLDINSVQNFTKRSKVFLEICEKNMNCRPCRDEVMIDNIESTRTQDISNNSPIRQSDSAKIPLGGDIDVSLQVSYAYIINRATQIPQTDNNAVQEARDLLKSGRLENEASTRTAAENIVKLGI